MNDTDPRAMAAMIHMIQQKTPSERLAMGCSMFDFSRRLVSEALRRQRPGLTDSQLRRELFLKFYGSDFDQNQRNKILAHLGKGRSAMVVARIG